MAPENGPEEIRIMFQYSKFQWQSGKSLIWQLVGLVFAWVFIVVLHLDNDGLWYQGDSPRHAANGLFWWDFLTSLSTHPVDFALSYYARYPVIHPTAYPPLFYIVEGFFFFLFGASPYVAKFLVATFALLTGVYVIAWLRRWVAPETGWGALLLMLQPGVVMWTNAVMLNVPSMAITLAALYHTRRWIESPGSRQIYLAGLFALMAVLTYFPAGVVVPILVAWILVERWRDILWDRRVWTVFLLSCALLVPVALVAKYWAPLQLSAILRAGHLAANWYRWTFYLRHMHEIIDSTIPFLAVLGSVLTLWIKHWRKEAKYLLIWIGVGYAVFSYIWFRESRYLLVLIPPVTIFAVIGLFSLSRWWGAIFCRPASAFFFLALSLLTALRLLMAPTVVFPEIEGFREVVGFLEKAAPEGRFFYDGKYDGVFSFYVRSGDPGFERGVVLGDKLLYSSRLMGSHVREYINSPAQVIQALRTKCGCEYIAIEKRGRSDEIAAAKYLREAVEGAEFQHVRSFPIRAPAPTRIDIYRFSTPFHVPEKLELHFPSLGEGSRFKVSPLTE